MTVCLMQIQIIDYDLFSRRQIVLPHILPHIKIRVTEGVFLSALDLIRGCRPQGRSFHISLPVYLIGWRQRWGEILQNIKKNRLEAALVSGGNYLDAF